jgi:hypothetical protein
MKAHCRTVMSSLLAWGVLGGLPAIAQTPTGRAAFARPSVSVRKTDPRSGRTMMTGVLGWRLAVRLDASGAPTFSEAAANADAGGLAFVEVSKLDYHLAPAEVDAVTTRLDELRLRVAAYRLEALPAEENARRRAFGFGKRLGASLIIVPAEASAFAALDALAAELDLYVAVVDRDSSSVLPALAGRSKRLGLEVDLGDWMRAGRTPLSALAPLRGRVLAMNLRDRSALGGKGRNVSLGAGVANVDAVLLELSRQQPPTRPLDYPRPPGQDGGGSKQEVRPVLLTLDPIGAANAVTELTRSAAAFDAAVRPAIRRYVDELARLTVTSTPKNVPADQRQRIAAAIPRQAPAKVRKPRTLLVLDLAYNGSFYHGSTPLENLSLQLMSEYTGAFTPVFSNDLDNLRFKATCSPTTGRSRV